MLTGEKMLVTTKSKPYIPCERDHYDNVPVRVSDLNVDLDRPAPKEKSPVLRTGHVS